MRRFRRGAGADDEVVMRRLPLLLRNTPRLPLPAEREDY